MATTTTITEERLASPASMPMALSTPEEALSLDLLIQLSLQPLHFNGELSGAELARRLGLELLGRRSGARLSQAQRQVEIAGGTMVGRASYRYRISDAGRARAALFLESNHYVGVAPVPFDRHRRYMLDFQGAAPQVATRDRVSGTRSGIWSSASTCSTSLVRPSTPGTRCSSTARRGTARR